MVDPLWFPREIETSLPIECHSQQTRPRTRSKKDAKHITQCFRTSANRIGSTSLCAAMILKEKTEVFNLKTPNYHSGDAS